MHCVKTLNVNANGLPTEHLVANKNLLHEKFFFFREGGNSHNLGYSRR